MEPERQDAPEVAEALGYRFRRPELLEEALTHRSYRYDFPQRIVVDNERLEFLGDAVLQLAVSEWLFERRTELAEGPLSRARSVLVRRESLAWLAHACGLGSRLRVGRPVLASGGQEQERLLAGCFEAIVGAIFLDGGYTRARGVVRQLLTRYAAGLLAASHPNPKGELQELLAAQGSRGVEYRLRATEGPAHRPHFVVEARVEGDLVGTGEGTSRKRAEEAAARDALQRLHETRSSPRPAEYK